MCGKIQDRKIMNICYIFRNSKAGFSIAKVFNTFLPHIEKRTVVELPCPRAGIGSIIKNIVYLKRNVPKSDIYHLTGNVEYCALFLPRKKTILTIHDLVLINHNDYGRLKRLFFYYFWFYSSLKRAVLITCISQKTKDDLLSYYPWVENKTIVIPNPVADEIKCLDSSFNKDYPIILHVGTRENKNLERVIEALDGISCELRIIGDLNDVQQELLDRYKINYSIATNLTDIQIAEEYSKCDIVSFPSTYEGFGMPIIEGFAAGRIVVTSNIEPMISIANGNAILVNPYDVEDIRAGFLKANDKEMREIMIKKGLEEVKKYSSVRVAELYMKVYKNVLRQ